MLAETLQPRTATIGAQQWRHLVYRDHQDGEHESILQLPADRESYQGIILHNTLISEIPVTAEEAQHLIMRERTAARLQCENVVSDPVGPSLRGSRLSAGTHWQTVVSQLPPGEFSEEAFWLLLDSALRVAENEACSPSERRNAARDALYLFKAQIAFSYREKKRPGYLLTTYRAVLPTIHAKAGATWSNLVLDELGADEVDRVLDAARRLLAP